MVEIKDTANHGLTKSSIMQGNIIQ